MLEFLAILGIVWVIAAVIQDFKHREIANWLNFSLILFALVFRLFYSIFSSDYTFFISGLFGLGVFFILGHILYYGRLFAGGDAKLFIALGAIIPFANTYYENVLIFFVFVMALLVGGSIYSIGYSLVLTSRCKQRFASEFKKKFKENDSFFHASLALSFVFMFYVLATSEWLLLLAPAIVLAFFFLYLYAKSVEQVCMIVHLPVNKLAIGDWLAEGIKVRGKTIEPHWEGLSEEQVGLIKKHYKKTVLVKQGIPFSPAFLIAFLVILGIQFLWNADWGFWQFF